MTSIFFRSMYNKKIVRFSFCDIRSPSPGDIQNNQGLGKGYRPQASADSPYLDLDYSGYHKTLSNNCFYNIYRCGGWLNSVRQQDKRIKQNKQMRKVRILFNK